MSSISKKKTITILVVIIVSAFLGTSIFNYISTRASLRKEIVSSAIPLLSENIYSEIQRELTLPINIASAMSRDSFLINWVREGEFDIEKVIQYLEKVKEEYGFFSTFFISDQTKNYYYYNGILKQIDPEDGHDEWYYKFIASGKEYDLDVDTDEASDNLLTIFINYRFEDFDGKFLGVIGVGVQLKNIADTLADRQKHYNKYIYLIDDNGIIQVHSDETKIEQVSIFKQQGIMDIASKLLVKQELPVNESYTNDRGRVLISSRYIPEMDWFIIIEQQSDIVYALARSNLLHTVFVGLVTTILLIILSSLTIGRFQKHLEMMASTDALTNVANRREFEVRFEKAQYRSARYNIPVSLIIIDIDDFKIINDEKGHLVGDKVLKIFTSMVEKLIRPDDLLARWGGDEFIILLESEREQAVALAERLRLTISGEEIRQSTGLEKDVTISIGVTSYKNDDTIDKIMNRVDRALYQSKETGKNRVTEIS